MSSHILLCCTGSVACVRVTQLVTELKKKIPACEIKIIVTKSSLHFLNLSELESLAQVHQDKDEWTTWSKMGDPVLHIELSKWADVVLFAPLDANTLSKLANGLSDNFVTLIARAWDFSAKKPFLFCPAMNTKMWHHPITSQHISMLESWGCVTIPPVSRMLACGDEGMGAMASFETIVDVVFNILNVKGD